MIKQLFLTLFLLEGLLIGLLFIVLGHNQKKSIPVFTDTPPLVSMEKTECYGSCPVYTIEIFENGNVNYTGKKHVNKIGQYQKQLSPEEIADLVLAFEKADFWSFQDEYVADVTDLPTTYLSFQYQGKYKKVKDLINAPQTLLDLELLVEAITEGEGWQRKRQLVYGN